MMRIAPGLVRIPDLSFINWDMLPGRESPREPIPNLVPDMAVEVLSEGNTKPEMARKVREYFDACVLLVWLIGPRKRTARVFSTIEKSTLVLADQAVDGGVVLPGFVVRLSDLLDRCRRPGEAHRRTPSAVRSRMKPGEIVGKATRRRCPSLALRS